MSESLPDSVDRELELDGSSLALTLTVNWGEDVKFVTVASVLVVEPVRIFLCASSVVDVVVVVVSSELAVFGRFFLLGEVEPFAVVLLFKRPDVAEIQLGREVGCVRPAVH